jgi:hypothetical protein
LKSLFIRCHVQIPSRSPCFWSINISIRKQLGDFIKCSLVQCKMLVTILSIHSIRKPNKALISAASWFPRIKCTFWGYSTWNKIWTLYLNQITASKQV